MLALPMARRATGELRAAEATLKTLANRRRLRMLLTPAQSGDVCRRPGRRVTPALEDSFAEPALAGASRYGAVRSQAGTRVLPAQSRCAVLRQDGHWSARRPGTGVKP